MADEVAVAGEDCDAVREEAGCEGGDQAADAQKRQYGDYPSLILKYLKRNMQAPV